MSAAETHTWADVRDRTDSATYNTVSTLYGRSPRYATELLDWCEANGWTPYTGTGRLCWSKLDNPTHKCSGQRCHDIDWLRDARLDVDHPVWLVRPDRSQWAVMSQEYTDRPDNQLAPYGHGTRLRLIVRNTR